MDLSEQGSIDDQAARWVARLDFYQPSPETLAAFKQWINQSAEHRQAFESYIDVWDQMNIATELVPPSREHSPRLAWPRPWLALASVMLVAIISLQWLTGNSNHYSTAIGEQRSITLPDGSTALLNTNSQINVHYSEQSRTINYSKAKPTSTYKKIPPGPSK